MISSKSYEFVKKAINVYDNLNGRTYLILYKSSLKYQPKATYGLLVYDKNIIKGYILCVR